MSFVIYDLETTGTNRHFDQILQFAAVKTNFQLEEEQVFETSCRLSPHVIPAPAALATNGLSINEIRSKSRKSHYEMICEVQNQLSSWCPTSFLGFNSIRFDEEFLRHALYQCLFPPYLTNKPPNTRADVLSLARAFASFYPERLTIPVDDDGRPKFNLRAFATSNGFPDFEAHEALADVRATLHVCKLVSREAPSLWSRFLRFAQRQNAIDFLTDELAILVFEPSSRRASYWVTRIGCSIAPARRHIHYCLNLNADIETLRPLTVEGLASRFRDDRDLYRKVKVNASPMLCPCDEAPDHLRLGRRTSEWEKLANSVQNDSEFVNRLLAACESLEPEYPPAQHVEQQLYGGDFWPTSDEVLMTEFHSVPWEDRLKLVSGFADRRLKQLSQRLIFLERPDLISETTRSKLENGMRQRMLGNNDGMWMTVAKARFEFTKLADQNVPGLIGYSDFLETIR